MDALVIMAKAPFPNQVKTRLTPPLEPAWASRLYQGFLLDKIEQVRGIEGSHRYVAFTPLTAQPFFARIAPGFRLIHQVGADLGERLAHVSEELFDQGFQKVLLLDSDSPTLPPKYMREGLARLDEVDVVLGPCEDGGYYLIGMRAYLPFLFEGIPWSTSKVLEATLEKAQSAGAEVSLLEPWYDVDTAEDLMRLQRDVDSPPEDQRKRFFCENTYRVLARMNREWAVTKW